MSDETTRSAGAGAAPMIHRCPNCGKRDTFKRDGVQFVTVSRVTVTTWACNRCGFRWVSLQRVTDGDTASSAAGEGRKE